MKSHLLYSPICCDESNQYLLGESENSRQEIFLEVAGHDGTVYGWSDSGNNFLTYVCFRRCNK